MSIKCEDIEPCWESFCRKMVTGGNASPCAASACAQPSRSCGTSSRGTHWSTFLIVGSILLAFVVFFVWPMGMCGYRSAKGSSCDRARLSYEAELERQQQQQQQQMLQQQRNRALQMQHEEYQRQQLLLQQQQMLQEAGQGCGYSASADEGDASDLPASVQDACTMVCPPEQPNCQMTRKQSRSCIRAIMEHAAKNGAITC